MLGKRGAKPAGRENSMGTVVLAIIFRNMFVKNNLWLEFGFFLAVCRWHSHCRGANLLCFVSVFHTTSFATKGTVMKSRLLALAAAAMALFVAGSALAAPIVYEGQLLPGVPTFGVNTQAAANQANPVGANYFFFTSDGGTPITIIGGRLEDHFDMSFWILRGLFNDTNQFGTTFDGSDAGFVAFADDGISHPGPFGDPQFGPLVIGAGTYTLAVTNFFSDPDPTNPNTNPFVLNASGVTGVIPEPASIVVWSLIAGVGGAGAYLRRRRKSA